jgi:hypothetical protein
MAQIQTTTSTPSVSFTKSDLDNLSNSFDQGDVATLSVINTLIGYMEQLNAHTHTVTDITYEAYGISSGSTSYTATTGTPSTSSSVSSKATGDLIDDSEIDQLVAAINALASHYHVINDQSS